MNRLYVKQSLNILSIYRGTIKNNCSSLLDSVSTFGQRQQCANPQLSLPAAAVLFCLMVSGALTCTHCHLYIDTPHYTLHTTTLTPTQHTYTQTNTHALHARLLSAANLCFRQQLRAHPFSVSGPCSFCFLALFLLFGSVLATDGLSQFSKLIAVFFFSFLESLHCWESEEGIYTPP